MDDFFLLVLAVIVVVVVSMSVKGCTETQIRNEAIEAGVAHWTIDPKTGDRAFEWKTK